MQLFQNTGRHNCALPAAALLAALPLFAESAADHKARMDAAQDTQDELRDALDAKSAGKALNANRKLIQFGDREKLYWTAAKLPAAVHLAEENFAAASELQLRLKAGTWDTVEQAYSRVQESCRACHDAHPEKQMKIITK